MSKPVFGESCFVSRWASDDNPHKVGIFVRQKYNRGKLNGGIWWELTDGKGSFWFHRPEDCIPVEDNSCYEQNGNA